ncbi:MAG TPA: helix-turn-helix domain-containing protein [Candidatus Paceibacterota bacterium]|nr:helix-turn-helix domain-containing protein [Verrucomicrobiota bacterium]HOX04580.1 helix-turn-helix domain-containing protein [Verrucomicrobiota bacterium]HRZ47548.1 helix-turn-helix domain-containing protein [Candidatus Paceibacterota bacterium]HRZ92286.1 helix-turn-helix domain-containing protein [Candidatus Paceibacterota bacterium]
MDESDILTLEEVARYLKLKPQTVYKWAQEQQIPGAKIGKEWRFRKSILDEWIDTSIVLSKAGFDLMFRSSQLAQERRALSGLELERLLRESMEGG